MIKSVTLTIFLLFFGMSLANSAIIDLGNITRDTATGLDWLDLTETRGISYNQVAAQFVTGGSLEGWRYATPMEFEELITNFGYSPVFGGCGYGLTFCDDDAGGETEVVEVIIKTLGDTRDAESDETNGQFDVSPEGAGYAFGMLAYYIPAPGDVSLTSAAVIDDTDLIVRATGAPYGNAVDEVMTNHATINRNSSGDMAMGSFLVRASPVPIPAASWLLGSALLGFIGLNREK